MRARYGRSDFRYCARVGNPARSNGARRFKISGSDRRLSRMAWCFVQHFRRFGRRLNRWPDHVAHRETRLVGEIAVWTVPRLRRAHLDVLRRKVRAVVFATGEPELKPGASGL